MRDLLFFVASSFWAGAAHAATPGHGKTIAAAYIVGARWQTDRRGHPRNFRHAVPHQRHRAGRRARLARFDLAAAAQRIEIYLAVAVGILVIVLGLWMLW